MGFLSERQPLRGYGPVLLLVAVLLGGAGCRQSRSPSEKEAGAKLFPTTKPSALAGQEIYSANCAACHGQSGAGDGPTASRRREKPASFTDPSFIRRREPQELFESVTEGKDAMPRFKKKLTDEGRWDAVFFAWSRATSTLQIAAGKNIYAKNCAACHGRLGDGKGAASAGLKKKPPRFNDPRFMMKEKSQNFFNVIATGAKPMPSFRNQLTEEQRWNAVDYIWTFVYLPAPE